MSEKVLKASINRVACHLLIAILVNALRIQMYTSISLKVTRASAFIKNYDVIKITFSPLS